MYLYFFYFYSSNYSLYFIVTMEIKPEWINFFTKTLTKTGYKVAVIHDLLVQAWGQENIVSSRQIHRIAVGECGSDVCTRHDGSGKPRTSRTTDSVDKIRELIQENEDISLRRVEALTGISKSTVERIIKNDLNLHSVSAKWVPYALNEDQKRNRVNGCLAIKEQLSKRNASRSVIVCDEKWIYFRSVPQPMFIRKWLPKDGSGDERRPEIARRTQSDKKLHLIFALNFSGQCYFELLEDGGSINSERYIQFIENAIDSFQLNNVQLHSMLWMHDNARPHNAHLTRDYVAEKGLKLLPQPAYSPDVNLCDRYVFRNFESYRQKKDFQSRVEVEEAVQAFIAIHLQPDKLRKELNELIIHCDKVVEVNGSYL